MWSGLLLGAGVSARADFLISEVQPLAGGSISRAYGINNSGFVAGESNSPFTNLMQAIRTNDHGTQSLGVAGGGWTTRGLAISDGNVVVGRSEMSTPNGLLDRGFVSTDPSQGMRTLNGLSPGGSTVANAISGGTIAGTATGRDGQSHAVTWDLQGNVKAIGGFTSAGSSSATGINAAGQLTGSAQTDKQETHAFLFTPGKTPGSSGEFKDLESLSKDGTSQGNAINNSGQVTGWSSTASGNNHAFAYLGDHMVDLQGSSFQGSSSVGLGINDGGWVVGRVDLAVGTSVAFLWRDGGGMFDLNTLIDNSQGWDLLSATGTNNHGQIVGFGIHNGQMRGYVLTPVLLDGPPVPEPSSLVLCGMAAATLMLSLARRKRQRTR